MIAHDNLGLVCPWTESVAHRTHSVPGEIKQIWNIFAIHAAVCVRNKNQISGFTDFLGKRLIWRAHVHCCFFARVKLRKGRMWLHDLRNRVTGLLKGCFAAERKRQVRPVLNDIGDGLVGSLRQGLIHGFGRAVGARPLDDARWNADCRAPGRNRLRDPRPAIVY